MSIITVMQTPADATKPHEKKKETRGISKKHTRRHTLPNLFVSLPLVPLFYYYYFFFCVCSLWWVVFFLPSSRVSHKEPRLFPLCPLNSCTCVSLFISMRCLSPFASKEPIYKRYFEFDDDFLLFVQCFLSFTLYKKIKQMKTTNDGAKK